jgi:hypothetical protein
MSSKRRSGAARRRVSGFNNSLLAVALLASCVAAGWIGTVYGRPFTIAARMRADNEKIERRIMDVKQENQRLRKEAVGLKTDQGMEREARRLGYLKQGEARLIVP